LQIESTHLLKNIHALFTTSFFGKFVNLISTTFLLAMITTFLFDMIITMMVSIFEMWRHILKFDLILMIVKDVVAGETDKLPLVFLLLFIALEFLLVFDLVNDRIVNLF